MIAKHSAAVSSPAGQDRHDGDSNKQDNRRDDKAALCSERLAYVPGTALPWGEASPRLILTVILGGRFPILEMRKLRVQTG